MAGRHTIEACLFKPAFPNAKCSLFQFQVNIFPSGYVPMCSTSPALSLTLQPMVYNIGSPSINQSLGYPKDLCGEYLPKINTPHPWLFFIKWGLFQMLVISSNNNSDATTMNPNNINMCRIQNNLLCSVPFFFNADLIFNSNLQQQGQDCKSPPDLSSSYV